MTPVKNSFKVDESPMLSVQPSFKTNYTQSSIQEEDSDIHFSDDGDKSHLNFLFDDLYTSSSKERALCGEDSDELPPFPTLDFTLACLTDCKRQQSNQFFFSRMANLE